MPSALGPKYELADRYLEARALLRTGRLAEARRILEAQAEEERSLDTARPQRFHRETVLLLSLLYALQGEAAAAEVCAREGIALGERLGSEFVQAVGQMRLGHAVQLAEGGPWHHGGGGSAPAPEPPMGSAAALYQRAIAQVRAFKVQRTQVEALWGLCRAYGYGEGSRGEEAARGYAARGYAARGAGLARAEQLAEQALEILQRAGDEWMEALIRVTLGASYVQAGRSELAAGSLEGAAAGFERVGDPLGLAVSYLWMALDAHRSSDQDRLKGVLVKLMPTVRRHRYDWLLTRRTFIGLRDDVAAAPLMIKARRLGIEAGYAGRLLERLGCAGAEYHPGFTLWVRALGPFAVWRGDEAILARDWKRAKALEIFQLLLTYRGQWFHWEQIADQLWPDLRPEAAERDFRVALNALNRALEPDRPRGVAPFFVVRRGSVYGLNPAAHVVVDADEMERLIATAAPRRRDQGGTMPARVTVGRDAISRLRRALALYGDGYLPEALYEDWASPERQRLRHLYLTSSERLARLLAKEGRWEEASQVCQAILARDNCWEAAYRLLMRAHARQGNRSQVYSVYRQCVTNLRDELGVEPSPETQALAQEWAAG
jgi:DNA-binding SARP family transcriptional activator